MIDLFYIQEIRIRVFCAKKGQAQFHKEFFCRLSPNLQRKKKGSCGGGARWVGVGNVLSSC